MNKSRLYLLGLVTLIGFPFIGLIVIFIFEENPWDFQLEHHSNIFLQLGIGALAGAIAGGTAWKIIQLDFLKPTQKKYGALIKQFNMNYFDIVFISICAGVGEELLFRGVIQPYWGILITSIVFVAIHGYLDPRDWRISIYGVFMTLVIIGIGYMNDYFGIISSITAHFVIDLILLFLLSKSDYLHELD